MAVTLAAHHRAVLIAGDAGSGGRTGGVVRLQLGRPPLVDNRLHVEVFLRRRHQRRRTSSLFCLHLRFLQSKFAAGIAIRDAGRSRAAASTSACARTGARIRLRR